MFFKKKEYQDIVDGCTQHEPTAQKRLYERFCGKMMAVCCRYVKSREEAEDILQEAFLKVFQNIHKYGFQGSLEGWIRRIMVNTAIDYIRKNKALVMETQLNENQHDAVNDDADALANLEVDYLMQIIQELPDGYRLVFNMFAIEGYSHNEIAEQLNITASTSRSQYARAKGFIKKRLNESSVDVIRLQDAI